MNNAKKLARRLELQRFATETQTTLLPGLSPEMKMFYEKRLIDLAEPKLVHNQFGDKYPIPKNGGKTIEFRKYDSLKKAIKPITEGVTPDGNNLNVTAITAAVAQYGDWIRLSDMLELTSIDNNVLQATRLLGSQSGRTLDTITRDVLNGGTNVIYAPEGEKAITVRSQLTEGAKLTPDLFFRAAAQLSAYNAENIDDSYVSIIHPYAAYDLMRNEEWIDVHKYATPENIYQGEIGKLGNVRFVQSTEAKICKGEPFVSGDDDKAGNLKVKSYAEKIVTIEEKLTKDQAENLAGRHVIIDGVHYIIESAKEGAAGSATITLSDVTAAGDNVPAASDVIYPGEGGAAGMAVFCTLVLGAHAYGVTEIEGGGLQHIVKQLGYGDDPLNQRSSCGWKATAVAKRLVEQYMIRIESGSAYSAMAVAN